VQQLDGDAVDGLDDVGIGEEIAVLGPMVISRTF
jgi:hypothetical protein